MPPLMRHSPGFGLANTELIFPLTRHAFLVGEFDGPEATIEVTEPFVAAANTKMIHHSFGEVYMPKKVIPYVTLLDGVPYRDSHFMQRFEEEAERYKNQGGAT